MTGVPVAARRGGAVQASLTELDGRQVAWFRLAGGPHRGAIGPVEGQVLERLIRLALDVGVPVVGELSTSGADVREGLASLHAWGRVARALSEASGTVPIVFSVIGPVPGRTRPHAGHRRPRGDDRRRLRLRERTGVGAGVHRPAHHQRRAGRGRRPRPAQRPGLAGGGRRGRGGVGRRRPPVLPAVQLAGRRTRRGLRRPRRPALPGGGHHRPRPGHRLLRRAHRDRRRRRPRLVPRGAGRCRAQRGHRLRPARRRPGGRHRQPAQLPGRHPRHRRVHQGGPLRPVLRRLRHPPRHLRRQLRASSRARTSSGRGSSATAPSWWRPTRRPPSPASASCCARPTAGPTSSWTPGAWAATSSWPGPRPRSR